MKNLSTKNIHRRIESAPMLKALLPFVVGIVLAEGYTLPLWGVVVGFFVCVAMAALRLREQLTTLYIVGALLLAGHFAAELRERQPSPTAGSLLEVRIDDVSSRREAATMGQGHIVAFSANGKAVRSGAAVRFVADTSLHIRAGERLLTTASVRDFDREQSYGRYMWRRGFSGQLSLRESNVISRSAESPSVGTSLREVAVERIARLELSPDVKAIAEAIGVGERSRITPTLRSNYTRSGAAHLLAVSGLHIGFLCVVANLLLWWLPLLRRGHLLRSAVIISAIWLYAAVVGFTPSVIRAAVMFTVMQAATNVGSLARSFNTLCFTAFVMLAWDARMIYDAGFLLSFLAVMAILEWGVPLTRAGEQAGSLIARKLHIGNTARPRDGVWRWVARALRGTWSAVVVSTVAAAATTPLAASLFGTASLWSVVAGPPLVALSAVAVGAVVVWVVIPIGAMQGVAQWLIEGVVGAMNAITEWCAQSHTMAFDWDLGAGECLAVYILFGIITLAVWAIGKKY